MTYELEPSDLPPLSRSSSTYSDDYITTVNSTGTLVHHRSHLQPQDGGTPRPYHDTRGRVLGPNSSSSIVYGEDVPADRPGIDSSFETVEEAEARRRWSAQLARAPTPPHSIRSLADAEDTPEAPAREPLTDIDFNDIGPRPPTPPRLRPRITGINNRFSVSSAADSWVTVSEDQNRMSGDFARTNLFHQHQASPLPLRAVQSAGVLREKKDASEYMLPPTNSMAILRPARSLRQAPSDFHRSKFANRPQDIPSRPHGIYGRPEQPIYTLGRNSLSDSSNSNSSRDIDPDELVSLREALAPTSPALAVRHRVAKDRYGQLVIDTIMEAPGEQSLIVPQRKPLPVPVPEKEEKYVKADVETGYGKEKYVTDLQKQKQKQNETGEGKKKSKNLFKRIFKLAKK